MRAFLAIPLPDDVADALGPLLDDLPSGRATDPEQLHLTLAFLGEQPPDLLETAHHALEAGRWALPPLRLRGLGTFGDPDPATLWAGVEPAAPLRALHDRLLALAHGAGIVVERRRYRPHVTLARLRPGADHARLARFLARWETFFAPAFAPEALVLYRSTLLKSGAHHEELARYPLAEAPPAP